MHFVASTVLSAGLLHGFIDMLKLIYGEKENAWSTGKTHSLLLGGSDLFDLGLFLGDVGVPSCVAAEPREVRDAAFLGALPFDVAIRHGGDEKEEERQ